MLDEPFGALDARVRQDLRIWIDELHRELGITSILVTHDQEEALELAQTIVVMNEGRIEQVGSPGEVYNAPSTPFVAGFVGAANVLNGLVIDGRVQFGEHHVAGAAHLVDGSAAHAYVRPHDVVVRPSPAGGAVTSARVGRIIDLGWTSKVGLQLADGQRLQAELPNQQMGGIQEGNDVYVDLRNARVFGLGETPSDELASV